MCMRTYSYKMKQKDTVCDRFERSILQLRIDDETIQGRALHMRGLVEKQNKIKRIEKKYRETTERRRRIT